MDGGEGSGAEIGQRRQAEGTQKRLGSQAGVRRPGGSRLRLQGGEQEELRARNEYLFAEVFAPRLPDEGLRVLVGEFTSRILQVLPDAFDKSRREKTAISQFGRLESGACSGRSENPRELRLDGIEQGVIP